MPKDYFSAQRAFNLSELSTGARIHVIGVSGVAMAQLAVALAEAGYQVSGSDKEFYEPMGSYLANSAVRLCKGYRAENVAADVQAVVIGNAVSYGHPEVDEVERRQIAYSFFPKLLHELLIAGRHSIVVAGTHGKSTTTAMIAALMDTLGQRPSYFIGGVARDLPRSLCVGAGAVSVVEGDEYDSAFFAKVPKFNFYHPETFIITSIEYDHADIYPDLQSIEKVFDEQVRRLPSGATVICCNDYDNLSRLASQWRRECPCSIVTYGAKAGADWTIASVSARDGVQNIEARGAHGQSRHWQLRVPGAHNVLNSLAALLAADLRGLDGAKVAGALAKFKGVKRRQEVRYNENEITVIEDFAHHPTAVRETIQAIRQAYPGRDLWAVFEPRSNTSRKKVFQQAYVEAFRLADKALLCDVTARANDSKDDLLDVSVLSQNINTAGTACRTLPDAGSIAGALGREAKKGDVFLIMSNGSFGGLIDLLLPLLGRASH